MKLKLLINKWLLILVLLSFFGVIFIISCGKNDSATPASESDSESDSESSIPASFIKQLGAITLPGGEPIDTDYAFDFALDGSGNIFVTGVTGGNLGETHAGGRDAYVVKFNSSGEKQWISQLGSDTMTGGEASGAEQESYMAMDEAGNIYITGTTQGSLGETNGGSRDAFVAKFNSSGVKQWISQLGSDTMTGGEASADEYSRNIVLDESGNIYIYGETSGSLGETNAGAVDIFIAKFNSSGVKQWISQLGSVTMTGGEASSTEVVYGQAMELDGSGNIYITGSTNGNLGETNAGVYDAFVAKFNSSGVKQWISQLGSVTMAGGEASESELAYSLTLDESGNIYIAGQTSGGLGETNAGSNDVFIAKFNSSGVKQWISQLGSVTMTGGEASGNDVSKGITLDGSGNIYIVGRTYGGLGEANGGGGYRDAFIAKFNSSGEKQWISQLGSVTMAGGEASGDEEAYAIALDESGNIYIPGITTGNLGETNGGVWDVFIAKFKSDGTITP